LQAILALAEVLIVAIFTVEYLLRAVTAERPANYVFGFWGFIDLIAIAPFYFGLGADLRAVRALRLLRLFRAFKLMRYNSAAERLKGGLPESQGRATHFRSTRIDYALSQRRRHLLFRARSPTRNVRLDPA
jgi:hypothetical protein